MLLLGRGLTRSERRGQRRQGYGLGGNGGRCTCGGAFSVPRIPSGGTFNVELKGLASRSIARSSSCLTLLRGLRLLYVGPNWRVPLRTGPVDPFLTRFAPSSLGRTPCGSGFPLVMLPLLMALTIQAQATTSLSELSTAQLDDVDRWNRAACSYDGQIGDRFSLNKQEREPSIPDLKSISKRLPISEAIVAKARLTATFVRQPPEALMQQKCPPRSWSL